MKTRQSRRELPAQRVPRRPVASKTLPIQKIDKKKYYDIAIIGPICITWGKHYIKNNKGKRVIRYYPKDDEHHLIWVKWKEAFNDEEEKSRKYKTYWSAEPQKLLLENEHNKRDVEKAINDKIVWPWPRNTESDYAQKQMTLLQNGYRRWKDPVKKNKETDWRILPGALPEPTTDVTDNDVTEESSEPGEADELSEDDQV